MSDPARPFSFETSFSTSNAWPKGTRRSKSMLGLTESHLFVLFAFVGAACLLWKYTIALGACVLGMTTFAWAMRERSRKWRAGYERLVDPPETVRVGANETGYWVRGDGFFAENEWEGVINGIEADGFLIVQSRRVPRVQFPIDELKATGAYEPIRGIVDARTAKYKESLTQLRQEASGNWH